MSRLIGLETEYATLVADRQDLERDDLPPSHMVYVQICEAIRRDQPTVAGLFDSEQMFLASGGAVTFESHPALHALPGGLVEIATPEVRSPDELLACQRSIDALAADAAADSETSFDLRVLKNSSDALGHVYGCHENYEAEVASGLGLFVYRMFVLLLWCMQIISLVVSLPLMGLIFLCVMCCRFFKGELWSLSKEPRDMFESVPDWMTVVMIWLLRAVHFPTVLVLRFVARHVAFRTQRKYLTAMLASRVALCGSGNLDHDGRYQMSAKAMAIDAVADIGGFRGERPIFVYGHWLGQFSAKSFLSLTATRQMLRRRQRLQIGLSDSNLADLAEYVKVGSVSLLLDMIEAGATEGLPLLRQSLHSLRRLASDWNLISRVPTSRGEM
ncbi:MAG: proteasome accessory factor PafA2 family protein, partial [Pirellulales bacterium]|nr:proteasome accessory factor PafA2 family protein [Pirellulales bacterium]